MIEHAMNILLRLFIACNLYISFPDIIPCFFMKCNQAIRALQFGENGQAFRFIQRIFIMGRSDRRTGDGKTIGFSGFDVMRLNFSRCILLSHIS